MNVLDIAIGKEQMRVFRKFTPEEMNVLQEKLSEEALALMKLKEQKTEFLGEINKQIKDVELNLNGFVLEYNNKGVHEEVTAYMVDDQDAGLMRYMSGTGEVLHERPLRVNEKQTNLRFIKEG